MPNAQCNHLIGLKWGESFFVLSTKCFEEHTIKYILLTITCNVILIILIGDFEKLLVIYLYKCFQVINVSQMNK